jgi:imidazolonepropionase-like amidohydrolase
LRTVFAGGRIFEGTAAPVADGDLAVEDGRIVDVGPGLDGDEVVDVSGATLLPGLIDCHVHVMLRDVDVWRVLQTPFSYRFYEAIRNLEATLRVGITTVRDCGGADLGLKRALEDGLIRGPRLQISLSMISQTGGHSDGWMPSCYSVQLFPRHPGLPDPIVDGPEEMRRKVRELVRGGADVIKVATSGGVLSPRSRPDRAHFRPDELEVLVSEARAAGLDVMAHAHSSDGIKNAVRAGIRSIEHGIYLDDEAIALMLERGTYLVPTLVAATGVLDAAERGVAISDAAMAKAREVIDAHAESFRRAVAAGVTIAMGTDSAVTPHGENLRELELMAERGMPAHDVLLASTARAAELLRLDNELGTLEPGKCADLVVVSGDPMDMRALSERVEAVYMDGACVGGGRGRVEGACAVARGAERPRG